MNSQRRVTRSQTFKKRTTDIPSTTADTHESDSGSPSQCPPSNASDSVTDPPVTSSHATPTSTEWFDTPSTQQPWEISAGLEEDHPMYDILDALMELPNVEDLPTQTFPQDQAAALDALQLNEQMQRLVETQINKIDQQIAFTEGLVKETRNLSILEARIQRKKMDIHRLYSDYYDFFEATEGTKPFTDEDRQEILESERTRTWNPKDRQQLSAGIHAEVQRMIAFDHVTRNEHWRVWEVDNIPKSEWENYPVDKLDWNRISKLYVKTRGPMECMIQWTTQDHPAINKSPWKRDESKKLAALVEKLGYQGKWKQIASDLNTDRTAAQCFAHYQAEYRGPDPKRPWTKEEDQDLKDAIMLVGDKNWQLVAVSLGGRRSGQQCLHRWKAINPAIRRSRWMDEEDAALKAAVAVYGSGNWCHIQRHIPGRTDMQCRERWMNVLNPSLVHGKYSDEEKVKLTQLVKEFGRKWSLIAEQMPGRTDNSCLRTWNKIQREDKKKKEKQQMDSCS